MQENDLFLVAVSNDINVRCKVKVGFVKKTVFACRVIIDGVESEFFLLWLDDWVIIAVGAYLMLAALTLLECLVFGFAAIALL